MVCKYSKASSRGFFLVPFSSYRWFDAQDDPELAKFEAQIAQYKALSSEIQALPSLQTMGWVKINAKPLRTALSTWVSKWINLFTQYLQEKVRGICMHAGAP